MSSSNIAGRRAAYGVAEVPLQLWASTVCSNGEALFGAFRLGACAILVGRRAVRQDQGALSPGPVSSDGGAVSPGWPFDIQVQTAML